MNVTAHRDARSLEHGVLEEMRRLAIARLLKGETQGAVAQSLQVRETTALSDNVSETATPEEFTVQGDGVVSHVSVYQS